MRKYLFAVLITVAAGFATSCGSAVDEGTVQIKTYYGGIERVYKPGEAAYAWKYGEDLYEVTLRAFTETVPVKVTSRDNAAIQVPISISAYTDPNSVEEYVRKFGFNEKERHDRRNQVLAGLIQTEARNAFAEYPAYEVYANQEAIQKRIVEALKPQLATQLYLTMESVQIGNPDFLDDRIEQAAGAVIANEKQKQSEEAALAAAEVAAKRKQVEAQGYANPQLYAIRRLELELEIERARAQGIASHQGPLTIVNGSAPGGAQFQIPLGQR
jgi:hypothetical protein